MNQQEIFNKAYLALKAQGRVSVSTIGDGCVYHNIITGDRCAVGHLINDEAAAVWNSQFNGNIKDIVANDIPYVKPWMKEHVVFLHDLQNAHDNIFDWNNPEHGFEVRFKRLADKYKLTIPTGDVK